MENKNGNIEGECLLSNNKNYPCATIVSYYSDGNVKDESYTNDSTWKFKEYYPNGKLKVDRIDTKQNNGINSTRREYYPNGKLETVTTKKYITSKNVWDNLDEKDEVIYSNIEFHNRNGARVEGMIVDKEKDRILGAGYYENGNISFVHQYKSDFTPEAAELYYANQELIGRVVFKNNQPSELTCANGKRFTKNLSKVASYSKEKRRITTSAREMQELCEN